MHPEEWALCSYWQHSGAGSGDMGACHEGMSTDLPLLHFDGNTVDGWPSQGLAGDLVLMVQKRERESGQAD